MPHADCAWQVCPPPWQHTRPVVQSADAAQTSAVPLGHVVPAVHVLELLPPSAVLMQHTWPVAQSVGIAHTCAVPEEHAV
jgi:hypothetical protein